MDAADHGHRHTVGVGLWSLRTAPTSPVVSSDVNSSIAAMTVGPGHVPHPLHTPRASRCTDEGRAGLAAGHHLPTQSSRKGPRVPPGYARSCARDPYEALPKRIGPPARAAVDDQVTHSAPGADRLASLQRNMTTVFGEQFRRARDRWAGNTEWRGFRSVYERESPKST